MSCLYGRLPSSLSTPVPTVFACWRMPTLRMSLTGKLPTPSPGGPLLPLPFANGERLVYDVTWLGMRAGYCHHGRARRRRRPGQAATHAEHVSQVESHGDEVLPVDNRGVSQVVISNVFFPGTLTFARREGKRFNDFDYTFRHSDGGDAF